MGIAVTVDAGDTVAEEVSELDEETVIAGVGVDVTSGLKVASGVVVSTGDTDTVDDEDAEGVSVGTDDEVDEGDAVAETVEE